MSSRHYNFGPFSLDVVNQRLRTAEGEIALRPKVFAVLAYLVERAGSLVTRSELLQAIWPDSYVDDHTVSVHIREVRLALGDITKEPVYIETRYRRGWIFKAFVHGTVFQSASATDSVVLPFSPESGPAITRPSIPETKYTRSGDVNIAYQVLGEGPVDLVFVMGWVSHMEYFWREASFSRFLRRLASFSRLILFDKRGTGLSDRVPIIALPTLEQRMDDLRAVMEAAESQKAVFFGVSEGGPLSAVLAATYPERTLALIMFGTYARRLRSADYPWGRTPKDIDQFAERIIKEWGGPVGLEERAPSMAHDAAFREWWSTYLRMGASPGAAVALTRMNAQVDVCGVLPSVRVPALILHRRGDRCLSVDEGRFVASLIPHSHFVELPGSDHLPFVGDQESVITEIHSFVTGLARPDALDYVLVTVLVGDFPQASPEEAERLWTRIANEVSGHRGHQMRTEATRLLATFDGPARAIRCACAVRNYLASLQMSFRAGLHTGECTNPAGPQIAGPALDAASALHERAKAGEILITRIVRDLASGSGLVFTDAGHLELPGLAHKRHVLRVIGCSRF